MTDQIGASPAARWQISRRVRLGLALYRNWFNLIDVQESQGTPPGNAKGHGAVTSLGVDVNWLL
jgi:hypothetical protein